MGFHRINTNSINNLVIFLKSIFRKHYLKQNRRFFLFAVAQSVLITQDINYGFVNLETVTSQ